MIPAFNIEQDRQFMLGPAIDAQLTEAQRQAIPLRQLLADLKVRLDDAISAKPMDHEIVAAINSEMARTRGALQKLGG